MWHSNIWSLPPTKTCDAKNLLSQIDSKTLNEAQNIQQNQMHMNICSTDFAAQNVQRDM